MSMTMQVLSALVPSAGVGLLFWFVMRAVIQADRRERQALAALDAEEARAAGEAAVSGPAAGSGDARA